MAHTRKSAVDDVELKTTCDHCCFAVHHETDEKAYWCTVHPTWTKLPVAAVHSHYCGQYMPEYLDETESSPAADPS